MDKELESYIKDALTNMFWAYTQDAYTESESIDLVLGYLRGYCPNARANPPKPTPVKDLVQVTQHLTRAVEKLDNSRQPDSVFESVCFKTTAYPTSGYDLGGDLHHQYARGPSMAVIRTREPREGSVDAVCWDGTWYTRAKEGEAHYLEEYNQQ